MEITSTTTAAALKSKSDDTYDFDGMGDTSEYGEMFMKHDCDVYDRRHGTESYVRAVECIGAIVRGNDDGEYAVPVILDEGDVHARFGSPSVSSCEENHLASHSN